MTDIPQTDQEKIDWLWAARDIDAGRIASLESEVEEYKARLKDSQHELVGLYRTVKEQGQTIMNLSLELNRANERSTTAVQEYIDSQKGE